MTQTTADAERVANDYVEMWNKRGFERLPELVSGSFVHADPDGSEVHGRGGLEGYMRGILSGFPDLHVDVTGMVSSGGTVMYEATLTMTHEGEFEGIPPTGREVEIREMATIEVANGRVEAHRVYFDNQETLRQLGLVEE
ncbi:MAG: ester cyclase [Haloarculaceae archaeon]